MYVQLVIFHFFYLHSFPWGLFNLETTMVSVLQNRLEYKVEKLKYKKF